MLRRRRKPMKTLILSCNTGEGHNSCAKAIKEYFDSVGEPCHIKDGLEFISPKASRFISWGHSFVYRRLPWLFKCGYGYSERHPAVFYEDSGIYKFMTQGSDRLYEFIRDGHYDCVICPHVFTALMVTDMLKKHPMPLSTCFVSTDYTCSPITKESRLDYYFIPDSSLAADFESGNIPEEKMVESGIPIRQMFYIPCATEEAKMSVDVHPDRRHLLLMCGSMGCGPIKKLFLRLSRQMPDDWEISVICGSNKRLSKNLKSKYSTSKRIHIREFVLDMGTMMDSAELYLTKPGGISVSEACTKGLPMVFIDAVAGCEEYNRIRFVRNGGAKTGADTDELIKICLSLMEDDARRKKMKESLKKAKQMNSSQIIYEKMKELTESRHEQNFTD